ncbi:acetyl esterase [Glycomyces sambucus]|uniref:Acetyl esterase n=1 Tax=Glycomyces sambucus TaxID=380244 RepID=A0A1G9FGK1_9ACTN|nr:alpha/beta hydrolase [Glycomyces sambucus]SDK87508.1 acetyl esterase [Glycomyces sambucus]
MSEKPHLGVRLLVKDATDWDSIDTAGIVAMRAKAEKLLASPLLRFVTKRPDPGARAEERRLDLPGRRLRLRAFLPERAEGPRPLVMSFHGGGFIGGSPEQNDWVNSGMSAALGAVVVGVDYRLAPEHPLPAPVEDGVDALEALAQDPFGWGIDPERIAVFGESAGGTIAALLALRSREEGPRVRAQVLVYPGTDWTGSATEYPSMARNGGNPGLSVARFRKCAELAVPAGVDALAYSPVKFASLADAPPALVVVGGLDAALDHGRRYVERLMEDGSEARITVYPRATHGFVSTPGLVPAARPARDAIVAFFAERLAAATAHR